MDMPEFRYCTECDVQQQVEDDFVTDNGDVDPRDWRVVVLSCGHSIETLVKP